MVGIHCFSRLNTHFQNSEKPKTYPTWLLRNCTRLVNWKRPGLGPAPPNHSKYFLKILLMVISVSYPRYSWPNDLWYRRYVKKYTLSHVLIIIMSQIMELMEWLKVKNIDYVENGAWLFYKRKKFFNCTSETIFLKKYLHRENLWKEDMKEYNIQAIQPVTFSRNKLFHRCFSITYQVF